MLVDGQRFGGLLQIVYLRPAFIAPAFALGHFLLNVHKPLHSVLFRGGYLGSGNLQAVFYGAWGSGDLAALRLLWAAFCSKNGKDSGAVKIVAQLPGGNWLCLSGVR